MATKDTGGMKSSEDVSFPLQLIPPKLNHSALILIIKLRV